MFVGLIIWRSLQFSHIWTMQLLILNVKGYIIFIQISFYFCICWQLCWIRGLRINFTSLCSLFPVGGRSKKFEDWAGYFFFLEGGIFLLGKGAGSTPLHAMVCLHQNLLFLQKNDRMILFNLVSMPKINLRLFKLDSKTFFCVCHFAIMSTKYDICW